GGPRGSEIGGLSQSPAAARSSRHRPAYTLPDDAGRSVRWACLSAATAHGSPDGARIKVEGLAHAQERERPGAVVAAQPAPRLTLQLSSLRVRQSVRLGADV